MTFHFYAASIAAYATTTDERDLPALINLMNSDGFDYALWFVPGDHTAAYSIRMYQPQVEGAKYLGHFTAPEETEDYATDETRSYGKGAAA
jgi:hypothetical protein